MSAMWRTVILYGVGLAIAAVTLEHAAGEQPQ